MGLSNWYKKLQESMGLSNSDNEETLNDALNQANEYLNGVDTSRSSASKLYQQGREVAGQAAADKAGIAKREAKAAAMMNGGGKLTSAVQGAQGAVDATQQGFDETAANAASLQGSQENAQKAAELSKATTQANNTLATANAKANTRQNAKNNRFNLLSSASQLLGFGGSSK